MFCYIYLETNLIESKIKGICEVKNRRIKILYLSEFILISWLFFIARVFIVKCFTRVYLEYERKGGQYVGESG